jgi:hypothetical protein
MAERQHTRGPWAVCDILDDGRLGIVYNGPSMVNGVNTGLQVGDIIAGANRNLRMENARLIAASTRMYDLLYRCLVGDGCTEAWLTEVRDLLEDEIDTDGPAT